MNHIPIMTYVGGVVGDPGGDEVGEPLKTHRKRKLLSPAEVEEKRRRKRDAAKARRQALSPEQEKK